MSIPRTERLILLLPWLAANPNVPLKDIAKRFNISEKQLIDDLALLTFIGPGQFGGDLVDIQYDDHGVTVINHQGFNRPLKLNATEVNLFKTSIANFYSSLSLPLKHAAESLLVKLTAIQDSSFLDHPFDDADYSKKLEITFAAVREQAIMKFLYRSEHESIAKPRRISPSNIVVKNGKEYVNGYCYSDRKFKSFVIGKMIDVELELTDLEKISLDLPVNQNEPTLEVLANISSDYLNIFAKTQKFHVLNQGDEFTTISIKIYNLEYAVRIGLKYIDILQIIEPKEVNEEIELKIRMYIEQM